MGKGAPMRGKSKGRSVFSFENLETRSLLSAAVVPVVTTILLKDEFGGNNLNGGNWHIPTWYGNGDGTYLGRTQLECSQTGSPPKVSGGAAHLKLRTYTTTMLPGKPSFYGSEIISNQTFSVGPTIGQSLSLEARVKLNSPVVGGYVGGAPFFYGIKSDGVNHDEDDFELVSNQAVSGSNKVNTNIYANEPQGNGSPKFYALPKGGKLTGYHTFRTTLYSDKVEWYIDGKLVRTETVKVPKGPVQVYVNMWAPGPEWSDAYNANLKPVSNASQNKTYSMDVDYVRVWSTTPKFTTVSASVKTSPASVTQDGVVTANGSVTGTSSGTVNYVWMVKKPDGTTAQVGDPMNATMTNGAAAISDFTGLPTNTAGDYCTWIHITSPGNEFDSASSAYTVTIPFTITDASVNVTSGDSVVQGGTVTVNGIVTGTGNGTVNYVWMIQGDSDDDPRQIGGSLSTTMTNGAAVIPNFTSLPTDTAGDYRTWIVIPGTSSTDKVDSTSDVYTVTAPVVTFSITGVSVNIQTTSPVTQDSAATANGSVTGTGNGNIGYEWQITDPNGVTTAQAGPGGANLIATMSNGVATIPNFTLPTHIVGQYQAQIFVLNPTYFGSPWTAYTVQAVEPVQPGISINQVPPLGSSGSVSGQVVDVNLADYDGVAVYLKVGNGWWIKPYFAWPLTVINADGTWSANITTGGYDITDGTEVRAYLIPKGFNVPLLGGGDLPDSLSALLYAGATRS